MKRKPTTIARAARKKISKNPELEESLRQSWMIVHDRIYEYGRAADLTVNDTLRLHEIARLAFLQAYVDGAPGDLVHIALAAVNMELVKC